LVLGLRTHSSLHQIKPITFQHWIQPFLLSEIGPPRAPWLVSSRVQALGLEVDANIFLHAADWQIGGTLADIWVAAFFYHFLSCGVFLGQAICFHIEASRIHKHSVSFKQPNFHSCVATSSRSTVTFLHASPKSMHQLTFLLHQYNWAWAHFFISAWPEGKAIFSFHYVRQLICETESPQLCIAR